MELPPNAIRIHIHHLYNVLRPRGGVLQKESLSLHILEKLKDYYESWTDEKYGDNPTKEELVLILVRNLFEEVTFALDKFKESLEKEKTDESTHCS